MTRQLRRQNERGIIKRIQKLDKKSKNNSNDPLFDIFEDQREFLRNLMAMPEEQQLEPFEKYEKKLTERIHEEILSNDQLSLTEKRVSIKNIDKKMAKLRAEFERRGNLVLKKNKSGIKKSASAARFAASLRAEAMMSCAVTYLATLFALGGKNKRAVKAMLESLFPGDDVEPLFEEFDVLIEEIHDAPLMEDMDEYQPLTDEILVVMNEHLEEMKASSSPDVSSSPEVWLLRDLLIENGLDELVEGKKVAPSGKRATKSKEEQLKRFFNFFNMFQTKLAEYGITSDEKIAKFLIVMIQKIKTITFKHKADGK